MFKRARIDYPAITDHEHYPSTSEEGFELYEDLRDFGGLSHEQAVETVGFEASRQVWGCEDMGAVMAYIIADSNHAYPFTGISDVDLDTYRRGAVLGSVVATEIKISNKEHQNV
jgi:hypothetical protein